MSLWTPSAISPHTWIDFSDTATLFDATSGGSVVTNGVGIARAEDKSGNGRNFIQATSGARFTFTSNVQNGLGVASGDGGDWLTSVSAASVWNFLHNSTSTVFIVNKNGTVSNPTAVYGWLGTNAGTSSNIGWSIAYDDRALLTGLTDAFNCNCTAGGGVFPFRSVASDGASVVTDFRDVITPNQVGLFSVRSDPANATAASRVKLAVNGGILVGNNQMTGAVTASNATFTLQIGTNGNGNIPIAGNYCEVVIFNSLLSTENQQLMEGYLAWKWGLQANLPSNHPYKTGAPTTGAQRRVINDGLFNRGLFNAGLAR